MSSLAQAFYLNSREPVFARYDAPRERSRTSVLLLAPFGWEETCSYRSRRAWARRLAADGHTALRIDLPGTGDSAGGPRDPGRLDDWTEAIATAARWLAADSPSGHCTAIGLGLGGLLAWNATLEGAPIHDLVLWNVPSSGATLVREFRAFSRLEASRLRRLNPDLKDDRTDGDESLMAAGFVLTPEAVSELKAVDLTARPLPAATGRRVLLIGRDGLAPDPKLRAAAERSGAAVDDAPGTGWSAMMAVPVTAEPPWQTIDAVAAWLERGEPVADVPASQGRSEVAVVAPLTIDGRAITETPLICNGADGILCEPADHQGSSDLTILLLNAGAIRRIGPNRMWVELARRWAARGVASVRLDLAGIGDADGADGFGGDEARFYGPEFVEQLRGVMDAIQTRRGTTRFGCLGLCSGAYWSLHAALEDDRMDAAFMLNPLALLWDEALPTRRDASKVRKLTRLVTYRRVLRGDIPLRRAPQILGAVARRTMAAARARLRLGRDQTPDGREDPLGAALDRLRDQGKQGFMLFTGGEPLRLELERSGHLRQPARWPNLHLELLSAPNDVHTLQPPRVQSEVHARVDRAIERTLAESRSG
jgi:alpha-beta hydrolase superfamily lysophospholipase